MSKSKGNVIPLVEIPKKYGADVYRTYVISAAEPGTLMDWRERDVPVVKNRVAQFIETVKQYATKTPKAYTKKDRPAMMTRWFLSKVNSLVEDSTESFDSFKLRDYALLVTSEMQRIVSQYVDRPEVPKEERDAAMAYACDIWVRLVTPIAPHICEEMWSKMKHEGYVSLAPWPKADKKMIDLPAERAQEVVEATIRDVREISKLLKEKTPKRVNIYVAPQWMFDAMDSVRNAKLPMIVGDVMKHLMSNPIFKQYGKEVKMLVDRMAKENGLWGYSASAKDEILTLQSSVEYLKSELGLEIVIQSAEKPQNDPQNKARFALPGRVSLFLE